MRNALLVLALACCCAVPAFSQVIVFKGTISGNQYGQNRINANKISAYFVLDVSGEGPGDAALIIYGPKVGNDGPGQNEIDFVNTEMNPDATHLTYGTYTEADLSTSATSTAKVSTIVLRFFVGDDSQSTTGLGMLQGKLSSKEVSIGFAGSNGTAQLPTALTGVILLSEFDSSKDPDTNSAGVLKFSLRYDSKTTISMNKTGGSAEGDFSAAVQAIEDSLQSKFPAGG